jgi:hypothetical protein
VGCPVSRLPVGSIHRVTGGLAPGGSEHRATCVAWFWNLRSPGHGCDLTPGVAAPDAGASGPGSGSPGLTCVLASVSQPPRRLFVWRRHQCGLPRIGRHADESAWSASPELDLGVASAVGPGHTASCYRCRKAGPTGIGAVAAFGRSRRLPSSRCAPDRSASRRVGRLRLPAWPSAARASVIATAPRCCRDARGLAYVGLPAPRTRCNL